MLSAILSSLSNTLVLLFVGGFGFWLAWRGFLDVRQRGFVAKLVNFSIPCFLFYSITGKFTQSELLRVLEMGFIPFITVAINWAVSVFLVRMGFVRKEWHGIFIACFTSSTVLFVGVPMTMALFGDVGIPYLLVYFFANCLYIWTVGLYNIQLDGVSRAHHQKPKLISLHSIRMLFSPPLLAFMAGVLVVLLALPIPQFISGTAKVIGQITSPLALIFIGMTIESLGFGKLKHLPREIWLILASCFILRPVVMYIVTGFFDMEPIMRQVFVASAALPVSSVVAVLAKSYGADEEFASEAIGASTLGLVIILPVLILALMLIS